MADILESLKHAVTITVFVFAMMVVVDYVNVVTKGRMSKVIRGGRFRQYLGASFLGSLPGCLGAFLSASFYIRGLVTFGAITACMIATSGDTAFVMIALFPKKAVLLFVILLVIGTVFAPIVDWLISALGIKTSEGCELSSEIHDRDDCKWSNPAHYLKTHVWGHIFKKHIWRVFLWSFGALLAVHVGMEYVDIQPIIASNMVWVLLIASLIGLIPDSGPNLIFVVMFANGLIPFSVLLTSSIVQDGHGILPLLSHSVKDTVLVKVINLIIGLSLGLIVYLCGW